MKMNSLNVRYPFFKQNGQYLIIDIANLSVLFLENLIKALQNTLILACSTRGGVRIPALGITIIKKGIFEIYEFDTIRGNFSKINSALNSLSTYLKINEEVNIQEFKDSIYLAIDTMIRKFSAAQLSSNCINTITQIQITIVSIKDCRTIESYIASFIENMEVSKINNITVVELQFTENITTENNSGFIQTIIMDGATHIQLENYFKQWLLDQSNDVYAILHFPESGSSNLAIKCDLSESIINPLSLPFGYRVNLQSDGLSVQLTGLSATKTVTPSVPVYELNVLSRVPSNDVCESKIFGLPLCVTPSQSWRLSVEEEQINTEQFLAICQYLNKADQLLLVQMRSHFQTDQFTPYFILSPGDGCMLLRCCASSDIILPWKKQHLQNNVTPSPKVTTEISSCLRNLNVIDNFNPNTYESGLYKALVLNLKQKSNKRNYLFDEEENIPSSSKKHYKRNK